MAFLIIFTMGYLFGGVSALTIIGLAVMARDGARGRAPSISLVPANERSAAWPKDK
jgi:hypothetical protein